MSKYLFFFSLQVSHILRDEAKEVQGEYLGMREEVGQWCVGGDNSVSG